MAFPIIKRPTPPLVASELVHAGSMSGPVGHVYFYGPDSPFYRPDDDDDEELAEVVARRVVAHAVERDWRPTMTLESVDDVMLEDVLIRRDSDRTDLHRVRSVDRDDGEVTLEPVDPDGESCDDEWCILTDADLTTRGDRWSLAERRRRVK